MINLFNSPLNRFRTIAFLEGLSFILIFITMVLKYKFDMPKPNYYVGLAHGILFVTYVFLLIQVKIEYQWSWKKSILAFLASLIPFGTFIADKKIFNSNPN